MWYRNSGGIVATPPAQYDEFCPPIITQDPDGKTVARTESWDLSTISPVCEDQKGSVTVHPIDESESPSTQSHATGSLHTAEPTNPANPTNVTSLFLDPSFNGPDPLLDFDWLFENIPSRFSDGDEGMGEAISPMQTASSDVSPPSFSQFKQSALNPDSFAPWMIAQTRLLEALATIPPALLSSSFFQPSNLSHFFDLYFENYHPHFPILHRPTLDPATAPPLLIAAIVTLGSTLSKDEDHFQVSTQIHDSLRYIIFTVITGKSFIEDAGS